MSLLALDGDHVILRGGERVHAEVILCATGYHLRFPYLDASVLDTSDDDAALFLGFMHPDRHDLFVVGVSRPTGAFWPIAEAQAKFIAESRRPLRIDTPIPPVQAIIALN